MNFEQLLEKEKLQDKNDNKLKKKKKIKRYFEFYIDEIKFYDLIIFQNINIRIINTPVQDKILTSSDLLPEEPLDSTDVFILLLVLILSYFFIFEFLTIWYKENILATGLEFNDNDSLNNLISSTLFINLSFPKALSSVNMIFNSSIIDFLNIYGYLC
jgi:hypothetical protein